MYKVIKLNNCPTLQINRDLKYPQHDYFTRTYDNPIVPLPRVTSLRINFKYQCSKIRNDIPKSIKKEITLQRFKRSLINHFLEQY